MTLDPRDAVRTRLADYLTDELVGTYASLVVLQAWPAPGVALPNPSIAITMPEAVPRVRLFQPVALTFTTPTPQPVPAAPVGTLTYAIGQADIGIQIDAWTQYPATRNLLVVAMDGLLNRPPKDTVSGFTGLNGVRRSPGLVLRLGATDFFGALCSFDFKPFARIPEGSQQAQTGEWRAIWTGTATLWLTDQQQVSLLETLQLNLSSNGSTATQIVV